MASDDSDFPLPGPNDASAEEEITERADTVWTGKSGGPKVPEGERRALRGPEGRVAIVHGCRTPFTKAGTELRDMDVIDMASVAAGELVVRNGLEGTEIDLAIFGAVIAPVYAPNLGREVVFRTRLVRSAG